MNQSVNTLVPGSYVPRASASDPANECVSTILSALFRDGCLRTTIVKRERADTHFKKVACAEVVIHD